MTTNYHTPWEDGVTEYKEADMGAPLEELDEAIGKARGPKKFDFMGQYLGDVLNSGALLMQGVVGRQMKLLAGAPGSRLYVGTGPTTSRVFSVKRNGVQVGTATVSTGGHWASFSVASDVQFYNGDLLELTGPSPADASMQDVSWNIILERPDIDDRTTTSTTTTTTTTTV